MAAPKIKAFDDSIPQIYAYTTPEIARHDGCTKIGDTHDEVDRRILQQARTVDVEYDVKWLEMAIYTVPPFEFFRDYAFHDFLTRFKGVERMPTLYDGQEWFRIDPDTAHRYLNEFRSREFKIDQSQGEEYKLRPEQAAAVEQTLAYFREGGREFLWNAKPRFGKTLATYDLVRRMAEDLGHPVKVLVVTNRPSISNSWADDFARFIAWRGRMCFVSDNDALKDRPGVYTRVQFNEHMRHSDAGRQPGMVAFESLQGLKGSLYFGGHHEKLRWINDLEFDLLVVDESQEGVDTVRTERAFDNIKRRHTLYLSGTPFKALADGRFNTDQIFNWSYEDEQRAKRDWNPDDGGNVYGDLPELAMYTYQMSPIIEEQVRQGAAISEDGSSVDWAFDLNEFFAVDERKQFKHEVEVRRFLDALTSQEKYPFSTDELRGELAHTLWLLNRVDSAKALARLLREHPVFGQYEIVLAAGDGRLDEDEEAASSYKKVKQAIAEHDKTITLSVGQLTVGVTVPEWSGVLMLSNMKSPSAYMQAAFRVQNPYETTVSVDGRPMLRRKERAYVFDFDPARTLTIYDEFANNLSAGSANRGTSRDRRDHIRELLNFFPVIGEDDEGRMVQIDAQQVLSIPRKLKSREVVRHGFISNYLFANISNIFGAPSAVIDILKNLTPAKKDEFDAQRNALQHAGDIPLNEQGEVEVPEQVVVGKAADLFGEKIYADLEDELAPALEDARDSAGKGSIDPAIRHMGEQLKQVFKDKVLDPALKDASLKASHRRSVIRDTERHIDEQVERIRADHEHNLRIAQAERDRAQAEAETSHDMEQAEEHFRERVRAVTAETFSNLQEATDELINKQPLEATRKIETLKAQEEKSSVEDDARALLRGFARAIPSFIMAYGDENLTLANFDEYTEDEVFEDVTGITEEQFRFLRDGGDLDSEHFEGHLFDETVFNDSIREFLAKRDELKDYFDDSQDEDIFDYIPPQKTNQIFTPKWVVKQMVDDLEKENPGCFDDPEATFADLYMKSGLYITEIVKRLFNSDGLKRAFPNEQERIRHILRHQVYGMAPTRIIYLIATNYILGFDENLRKENRNFVQADAAAAAKEGTLPQLVDQYFDRSQERETPREQPVSQEPREQVAETVEQLKPSQEEPTNEPEPVHARHREEPKGAAPKNAWRPVGTDWLVDYLRGRGLEIRDRRANGGSLWVIGDETLRPMMDELRTKGVVFQYKPEGGRVTKRKSAWWMK